ncbi:MAG: cell wall-binding repeat-containing protein [Peptostreptococcus sp.]|uniref:cell wall-binding repeat-containing protein n=1 Tax=Peptostreptococcus sp. TaxID=1262 RepID=UPI002FCC368A
MNKKTSILLCSVLLSSNLMLSTSSAETNVDQESKSEMEVRDSLDPESIKTYNKTMNTNFNTITGKDRYETSVNISKKTFESSRYAIIVNGEKYPDSISSIPVAAKLEAPIILTRGVELEKEISEEIKRLGVENVYIIGGINSVSNKVEKELKDEKIEVTRYSGQNRYDTNREVVDKIFDEEFDRCVFASGENFADSISIGSYVYKERLPILLISDCKEKNDFKYIEGKNIRESLVIGGEKAVSKEDFNKLENPRRYSGINRYETSEIVNRTFFKEKSTLTMTTGDNFADALSGVPYADKNNSNLVLYNRNPKTYPATESYETINVVGGSLAKKIKKVVQGKIVYNDDYIKYADLLLENKIAKDANINDFFVFDGDFKKASSENRTDQRRIYGFFFLNDLSNAYNDTGKREYIRKGIEYIKAFESQNKFDLSSMMWHDETVGRRLNYYLNFYKSGYNVMSASELDLLKKAMADMANRIAYTNFWAGINNHGMFQDLAILCYADEFGNKDMYRLAARRLETYFEECFDKDGVHLENSPEYHFVILGELKHVIDNVDKNAFKDYNHLYQTYKNSEAFSRAIILPNGYLPNIGDTKTEKINLNDYYAGDPNNEKIYGRSTFYDAGYDIVKNSESYLLFRAGYKNDVHHHNDDLSIWLYKNGNIITEVGSFGYEYSNPYADYSTSFEAHNNLVVDGKNVAKGRDVILQQAPSSNTMKGSSKRIQKVKFERQLDYNDNLTNVKITDKIESLDKKEHKYELRFHLDPEIRAEIVTNSDGEKLVQLYRRNTSIGQIKVNTGDISVIKDVYFPYYYAQPEATDVVHIELNAKDANIETNIELK